MSDHEVPPCTCPVVNLECRRAGVMMTEGLRRLCAGVSCTAEQSAKFRKQWDELYDGKEAPIKDAVVIRSTDPIMSSVATSPGLGDLVHNALAAVGITTERVEEWIGAPCNCPERIEKLNAIGRWATKAMSQKKELAVWALRRLTGIKDIGANIVKPAEVKTAAEAGLTKPTSSVATEAPKKRVIKVVPRKRTWAYGITTIPSRRDSFLPRTLKSLASVGFNEPRLFIDGCTNEMAVIFEKLFNLPVTARNPAIKPYGSWVLAIWELYARDPGCDYYAVFQDDVVAVKNLRDYLERCPVPDKGYLNLYTNEDNAEFLASPRREPGWHHSNQLGKGALGLVFSKFGVQDMVSVYSFANRMQDKDRGWRKIDGAVFTALDQKNYKEYVHLPSLLQHTGVMSSMGNAPNKTSPCFAGEDYDPMQLPKACK